MNIIEYYLTESHRWVIENRKDVTWPQVTGIVNSWLVRFLLGYTKRRKSG